MIFDSMEKIPFNLQTQQGEVTGHLNIIDKSFPPQRIHVMEKCKDGDYYRGQLLLVRGHWSLPDSKFKQYADWFGELVQQWYG